MDASSSTHRHMTKHLYMASSKIARVSLSKVLCCWEWVYFLFFFFLFASRNITSEEFAFRRNGVECKTDITDLRYQQMYCHLAVLIFIETVIIIRTQNTAHTIPFISGNTKGIPEHVLVKWRCFIQLWWTILPVHIFNIIIRMFR